MKKPRLLDYLLTRNPEFSKKHIHSLILCGDVRVNGSVIRDPKFTVNEQAVVSLVSREFVSRGGYKLNAALTAWGLNVKGKVMLDAGASTGGFTDVLLKNGAVKVYAVDVGYNQLDYSLRKDERVVVMERTNIMDVAPLSPQPNGAVADLSFRSLKGAAEKILSLTSEHWCICLIKPQFEIDGNTPGFDGIIRDRNVIEKVLMETVDDMRRNGLKPVRLIPSAIKGAKGNQEFLVLIDQDGSFFKKEEKHMVESALAGL